MTADHPVIFCDAKKGIAPAVAEIFEHFGGLPALLKPSKNVYIKVNGVDAKKFAFTDPRVLAEVIRYLRENGADQIYVMENATQGNITRLVFKVTGFEKVCRETGAIPVFLDETPAVPVFLEGIESFVDISAFVFERLMKQKDENLYISIPKLKTHSMSQVTLSIKNQFGFIHHHSRIADHNYRLHRKFADIYALLRPDLVIVDGLIATNHGHYNAEANADQCVVPMNLLVGGTDPLAVDIAAASLLGFDIEDVPHLRFSKEKNISTAAMDTISLIHPALYEERRKNLTHQLLERFPPDLTILRGKARCCPEGCRRNTEAVAEVFFCDHQGKGGFTILMGKGIDRAAVDAITTPAVHLAGGCAIQDYGLEMVRRFGKRHVTFSHGCNNLSETVHALCKQMHVSPLGLSGTHPVAALAALVQARLHGSRALIPRLI